MVGREATRVNRRSIYKLGPWLGGGWRGNVGRRARAPRAGEATEHIAKTAGAGGIRSWYIIFGLSRHVLVVLNGGRESGLERGRTLAGVGCDGGNEVVRRSRRHRQRTPRIKAGAAEEASRLPPRHEQRWLHAHGGDRGVQNGHWGWVAVHEGDATADGVAYRLATWNQRPAKNSSRKFDFIEERTREARFERPGGGRRLTIGESRVRPGGSWWWC